MKSVKRSTEESPLSQASSTITSIGSKLLSHTAVLEHSGPVGSDIPDGPCIVSRSVRSLTHPAAAFTSVIARAVSERCT